MKDLSSCSNFTATYDIAAIYTKEELTVMVHFILSMSLKVLPCLISLLQIALNR